LRLSGEAGNPLAAERRNVWVITAATTAALLRGIFLLRVKKKKVSEQKSWKNMWKLAGCKDLSKRHKT
jgi:hypothetical protein